MILGLFLGLRSKNFWTCECTLSTCFLKVQPCIFVFNSIPSGALYFLTLFVSFRAFFGPFRAIFEVEVRFKKYFFGHTNVDYKLWFLKYSPIFLFIILALFEPWGAIFGVRIMFKILFRTYLCRQLNSVLEVQSYFFVFFNSTSFGALFF